MKLWIKSRPRKDGKFACTYGFDNGVRLGKIKTADQLRSAIESGLDMTITDADWSNTISKAHGQTLFYEF